MMKEEIPNEFFLFMTLSLVGGLPCSSEEETKIDLNEENQDIKDKIFELKKLEKEKKFSYTLKADFKKRKRRKINE